MEPAPHPSTAPLGESPVCGGPDGPKPGGSWRHVQPVVATNTMAASTWRSPYRRRPPPCGRTGAAGTTRWNDSHNLSGTSRSTIAITSAGLAIKPVETISKTDRQ